MNANFLRKKYKKFIYEKYDWQIVNSNLKITFFFSIKPGICFKPTVIIPNVPSNLEKKVEKEVLDNLIFHLGLIEILTYWKATCSPEIEIKAGPLDQEQINWWQDLIKKGMSQFFYENRINFKIPNFLKFAISSQSNRYEKSGICDFSSLLNKMVLIPVGGGKDSVVTSELLKKSKKNIQCFSLNPTEAARKIMKIAGCKNPIIVKRKIDPGLLRLNRKGFLNGHTPFSAYLAFLSVLIAVIFDQKYIALSNERSSNEGNVKYLGGMINHQYSKSFDFEEKFRKYSKKYLVKNIEYFSFLRPLYEIQIVKLFSKYPKYFNAFLSCNEAYKTYSGRKLPTRKWCGKCPKCLFVFVSLYPFIETKKLIKIFGGNLFENQKLLPVMQELMGERGFKPFECVGTKKESLIAFYLALRNFKRRMIKIPFLLRYFGKNILPKYPDLDKEVKIILTSWDNHHNLPEDLERTLRSYL